MTEQLDLVVAASHRDMLLRQLGAEPGNAPTLHAVARTIADHVAPGERFSLNTIRDLLPASVRPNGIGPAMAELEQRGVVSRVSQELSTKPSTRGKPIAVYVLRHPDRVPEAAAIRVRRRAYGTGWRWRAEWPDGSVECGDRTALDLATAAIATRTGLPIHDLESSA